MDIIIQFVAKATLLLFVPGPTNSIIATSGALYGFRRTLRLLPFEVVSYVISIYVWGAAFAIIQHQLPAATTLAKLAVSIVLLHSAHQLWFAREVHDHSLIGRKTIFLVTLTNPKAIVFAVAIVPHLSNGHTGAALPYMVALAFLILSAGCCWAAIGATLVRMLRLTTQSLIARTGAVVIFGFALMLLLTIAPFSSSSSPLSSRCKIDASGEDHYFNEVGTRSACQG